MSAPLVASLVRAVVFLLRESARRGCQCDPGVFECEPCRLLRDVEREAA